MLERPRLSAPLPLVSLAVLLCSVSLVALESRSWVRAVSARQSLVPDNLRIAAFNVRIFGIKKMNDPKIADVLVKVSVLRLCRMGRLETALVSSNNYRVKAITSPGLLN